MGNLKGPKFGDIDWRDDISEKEIENLFKSFGKNYTASATMTEEMGDGTQHTTTTTTTQSADGTKTQTTTSTWTANVAGFGSKIPLHERIKQAEIKAKAKMAEMEAKKMEKRNSPKTKKPSFFDFGNRNSANDQMDLSNMLQQMQGNGTKRKDWDGPTIKGFDDESLKTFVDEMMEYQQKEFEKKLASEPVPDGLIGKAKQKVRQNAERVLFNLSHKIRGIMAQGMLRKISEQEKKNDPFRKQ